MIKLALIVFLALHWGSASAASFDCKKARSTSERLVCADPELSAMDEQLAVLVIDARRRAPSQAAFTRALEAAWSTRQQCTTAACVKAWYLQRIADLGAAPAAPVATPPPVADVVAPVPPALALAPSSGKGRIQVLGRKLGFEIPATKADFVSRFTAMGGQCGAGKFRPLKEMYRSAAVSECWIMAPCPSPSEDMKCGVVRIGFDARQRAVIFMTQLQAIGADAKAGSDVVDTLVRVFNAIGGKPPRAQDPEPGATIKSVGTDGPLTYQAMVVTPPTGNQFVIVSIIER